ncbi:hypothetical protein IW140_006474 [Coemansia sp. RSA 1813]|nr:hypothetical protein EV179_006363 [Coemansia sp. RSA 487]KAJ2562127.1 hypothetical protein IW140_006474 [Coemansia sp. RSA 1813]
MQADSDDAEQWTGASHVYELDTGGDEEREIAHCLAQWDATAPGTGVDSRAFRSAQWSPDGTMVATVSEDNALRVYDANNVVQQFATGTLAGDVAAKGGDEPSVTVTHGETVLDYAWYPHMNRHVDGTNCIVESMRDHPIHLRDTEGPGTRVRATYRAVDACDALLTATALAFAPDACGLFAGYAGHLAHFDVHRPGLPTQMVLTSPNRRSRDGMKGIVSCVARMDAPSDGGLLACASLGNHVSLYSRADLNSCAALWTVPQEYAGSGVTALQWARGGTVVWAASRRSPYIVGWDVRDLRGPWAVLQRPLATTNQRLEIDVDGTGRHLVAGQVDGTITVYDPADNQAPVAFSAHNDAVPAVAMHPFYPLLVSASGQRHFGDPGAPVDCSLKIWSLDARYLPHASAAKVIAT